MSKSVLEENYSLKDALKSIRKRLEETDEENIRSREFWKAHDPSRIKESMEEENWNDSLYLVYRNENYDNTFYIFKDDSDIVSWLENKWDDWCLWDYDDIQGFLDDELIVWKFHRDICIDKWEILYKESKPFIKGWSRKREYVSFETVPSFSIS
ncbi:hypothetical protein LCM23_13305 [Cytobacillus kochii]|uniref:hypothetical protein n=1 Tax=Cytobacillus kochii TaxID=859143 RepID=UPI001CD77A1D|nr:hypothetical protein [Cytobacillus kochii]MCA1027073.1 hypothetical protein [Cytobacillus kochii]